MSSSPVRLGLPRAGRLSIVWWILSIAVLVAFALGGPTKPLGMAALGVAGLAVVSVLPRPPWAMLLPLFPLSLLTPQLGPGYHLFDGVIAVLGLLLALRLLATPQREAWEIHFPGGLCLLALAAPLLALPTQVVSLTSFVGLYKQVFLFVVLFIALRRLVSPRESHWLLWAFPIVGGAASLQLLARLRDVGGGLYLRPNLRSFFTSLGWGESNYVAALLALCLLGTLLALALARSRPMRVILVGASALMMYVFMALFSRGATVALAVAALVLILGWGGWRSILVAAFSGGIGFLLLLTPGGRVLMARFSEPSEYSSWYSRVVGWHVAWERFLAHPLTGIGLNQGRYQGDELGGASAHNIVLESMMEQGILGGLLVLGIFLGAYRLSVRAVPAGSAASPRVIRSILVALVTGVFINANVEPTVNGYAVGVLFVWLLAWLALQDPRASRGDPAAAPAPARALLTSDSPGP